MEFAALRAFLAVVDAGSFAEAASEMGQSRMTVTRRVNALEERLGQALLVRSEAGAAPTPVGLALHREAQGLITAYLGLLEAARRPPTRECVLAVPPALMAAAKTVVLPRWRGARRLVITAQDDAAASVALGHVALVAAYEEPARYGPAMHVGELDEVLAASEAYVATHGLPSLVDDLADHRIVAAEPKASLPTRSGGWLSVSADVVLPLADVTDVVRSGLGIGLVSRLPGLVPVLDESIGRRVSLWLVGDLESLSAFEQTPPS